MVDRYYTIVKGGHGVKGGSSCSRVEDQDWARPAGRVASEAVLKLKTTLEFVKAISRVAKADVGRAKDACGAKKLIMEKQ